MYEYMILLLLYYNFIIDISYYNLYIYVTYLLILIITFVNSISFRENCKKHIACLFLYKRIAQKNFFIYITSV